MKGTGTKGEVPGADFVGQKAWLKCQARRLQENGVRAGLLQKGQVFDLGKCTAELADCYDRERGGRGGEGERGGGEDREGRGG